MRHVTHRSNTPRTQRNCVADVIERHYGGDFLTDVRSDGKFSGVNRQASSINAGSDDTPPRFGLLDLLLQRRLICSRFNQLYNAKRLI